MKKIYRIADNPFDDREITTERLAAFGADAAEKLAPEFASLAAPIRQAVQDVLGHAGTVLLTTTERTQNTGGVDALLEEIARFMREAQPHVIVALGAESAGHAALYPDGMRTYTRLTKTGAPAVLDALAKAAERYGAPLDAERRSTMAGFKDRWEAVRRAQNSTEGALAETRNERDESREQLEDALYDALLTLAGRFKRQPERVRAYFDHTLLSVPRHRSLERGAETPSTAG